MHTDHGSEARTHSFKWFAETGMPADVVDMLSDALGDAWVIERQSDYDGEVSIIVLPKTDPDSGPNFILFEQNGSAALARICMETWSDARPFRTFREATDALIAGALAYSGCARLEPAASDSFE